jgi:hypothetical protein
MRLLSVAVAASVIMAALMGCASSHSRPRHEYVYHKHYTAVPAHGHATGRHYEQRHYSRHGHHAWEHHAPPRPYRRPPPVPGRTPDGRYVLPGGLESTCAGGTPPPCQ